jgi:hypothetical protein
LWYDADLIHGGLAQLDIEHDPTPRGGFRFPTVAASAQTTSGGRRAP